MYGKLLLLGTICVDKISLTCMCSENWKVPMCFYIFLQVNQLKESQKNGILVDRNVMVLIQIVADLRSMFFIT